MNNSKAPAYWPAVDGLRAIAVLAVVIFHAFPHALPGGFVGVDVFFVISGFLITKIIHAEIITDRFNVRKFYLRRIKRILPAYIVVCVTVVTLAWSLLIPADFLYFTTSLAASWAFASNIFFSLLSGGYFSPRTETFPLLHTWSLSVEEQFYFVFPLLLIVLHKVARQYLMLILPLLFVAFVLFSEQGVNQTSSFYALQYRAHELLLGALVHFIGQAQGKGQAVTPPAAGWLSWAGLGIVVYAIAAFSGETKFPGVNSLVPCVGAALILHGSQATTTANDLLSHPVLVFIGKVSYSFYLWHWPILAFLKITEVPVTLPVGLGAIALSLALAYLSWRFVENPVRASRISFNRAFLGIYVAPAAIFLAVGLVSYQTQGLPQRFPPDIRELTASYGQEKDLDRACSIRGDESASNIAASHLASACAFGARTAEAPQVLLLGDSHASHFKPFLHELATDAGLKAVYHVQGNCAPIELQSTNRGPASPPSNCEDRNDQLYALAAQFKYVVLAGNWRFQGRETEFEARLDHALARLAGTGAKILLFKDNASIGRDLSRCFLNRQLGRLPPDTDCHMPMAEVLRAQAGMDSAIERVASRHPDKVVVIEPKKVMCTAFECLTYEGNTAFYRDENHINETAALQLGRRYIEKVGNPLKDSAGILADERGVKKDDQV